MLHKVQKYIEELNMISSGDKVLVGVSGGADSVCLLMMLCALSKEMDFSVEVIHIEHGIRGEESKRDQGFVEELCRQMNLTCHVRKVDVIGFGQEAGLGTEEAARILRYQEFASLAKALDAKVALAHHMEDNAETILFQLARGSSLTGLCGMQPVRMEEQGVMYIRPFLSLHREEIENYLKMQKQEYCVDSTNQHLDYSRNYIRHVVLPELGKINERSVAHINETASHLSDIRAYVEQEVNKAWLEVAECNGDILLDVKMLQGLHIALQKEIVYKAIAEISGGKKDIAAVHVNDLLALCDNQSGKMLVLPNGIIATKEFQRIRLTKNKKQDFTQDAFFQVSAEELSVLLEEKKSMEVSLGNGKEKICMRMISDEEAKGQIPKKTYTKWFDYDKIKEGFGIRTRKSGDYFIGDVYGHRKKVKQYFVEEKIPVTNRERIWLLTQEEVVLWIIGGRISEHVKVTEETNKILEITYDGGK